MATKLVTDMNDRERKRYAEVFDLAVTHSQDISLALRAAEDEKLLLPLTMLTLTLGTTISELLGIMKSAQHVELSDLDEPRPWSETEEGDDC